MFGLLKQKNPYEQAAQDIYQDILHQVRTPLFYSNCGVPDSFDGRFDLLMLHVFIVLHAVNLRSDARGDFGQALFDVCFTNMDQTLREIGIGDMGIHKHMKRILKGYNGRMHAYEETVSDMEAFKAALRRNVYGTLDAPEEVGVEKLADYVLRQIEALEEKPLEDLYAGQIEFVEIEGR